MAPKKTLAPVEMSAIEAKKAAKRSKNREAAARCRQRRKMLIEELSANVKELNTDKQALRERIDVLEEENATLRNALVAALKRAPPSHRRSFDESATTEAVNFELSPKLTDEFTSSIASSPFESRYEVFTSPEETAQNHEFLALVKEDNKFELDMSML
eukprot:Clim_evm47s153 gene=Clim_evmTU47s153